MRQSGLPCIAPCSARVGASARGDAADEPAFSRRSVRGARSPCRVAAHVDTVFRLRRVRKERVSYSCA